MANRRRANAQLDARAQNRAQRSHSRPLVPVPRRLPWIPESPSWHDMKPPTGTKPSSATAHERTTRPRTKRASPTSQSSPKNLRTGLIPSIKNSPSPRASSPAKPRTTPLSARVSKPSSSTIRCRISPTSATSTDIHANGRNPPLSQSAKRALLEPDVCVWARMDTYPWWPTVIRRRADIEPTLDAGEILPAETRDNRLVEFFNDDNRVAVMHIDNLEEYTGSMNLLEEAGNDIRIVVAACIEADAYIRSTGPVFQREAVGSAFSKIARARKKHYAVVKNTFLPFMPSDFIPSSHHQVTAVKEMSSCETLPLNSAGKIASTVQVMSEHWTTKVLDEKYTAHICTQTENETFNIVNTGNQVVSQKTKPQRVLDDESTAGTTTAATSSRTHTVNKNRPRTKEPASQPPSKRPRIKEHVITKNDHSEITSSPDSTPLKLFLSRSVSRSRSRSKSFDRSPRRSDIIDDRNSDELAPNVPPPAPISPARRRRRRGRSGIVNLSARINGIPGINSGSSVEVRPEEDAVEDWGKAGEEMMEKMNSFAIELNRFLGRKKNLQDEVRNLVNRKMQLEEENKMLGEKNEMLKIVNEEQQSLTTIVQKRGEQVRNNIAKQRTEYAELNGKIEQMRRTQNEMRRWFDHTHHLSSELMKEESELDREVRTLRSRSCQSSP